MQRFKLANVLLEVEDFLAEDQELFYRAEEGSSCAYDAQAGELSLSGLVDFATYFNGVPVQKWRRYADVARITLHVEVAGDACTIAVRSLAAPDADAPVSSEVADVVEVAPGVDFRAVELAMPADAVMAGFAVMVQGTVRMRNAFYFTEVEAQRVRPVRLALCTTTFCKEDYIVPNIDRIKADVLAGGDSIADSFHMFVVDNGCTLDVQAISDDHVTVIPNPNVGGSGGFARGMMAAQDDPSGFTHVILMDDDVRMSSESFKRTFALLSLVNDDYLDACLNGAMLEAECPSMQYEDVGYVRRIGGYDRIKLGIDVSGREGIVRNELIDVEHVPGARTYGAWWYCCIPMSLVNRHGLPMPFFVRCDDVEYGARLNATYMTLSGICVWHAAFERRFSAQVACYQYVRNMFAMMAMHGDFFDQRGFLVRFWRTFHFLVRMMDYDSAGLWLDGFEDYLKGPDLLARTNGARLLKENGKKAEKLAPIDELDPGVMAGIDYDLAWLQPTGDYNATNLKRALLTIPHDRHWAPGFVLSSRPGVVATGFESFTPWWKTAMRDKLVALSFDAESGHVRVIDRARYAELNGRFRRLMRRFITEGSAVASQWRNARGYLASREFWDGYLQRMAAEQEQSRA